jgi:hypothetical protein|tara:strand:+ start:227 stop:871 length:645 start_codon:yes stop_codon:yes gene_type:complete
MALGTFTELKDAIADWLDRSDLTDRIPDFITLAEARLNRDLRIRPMEVRSTMTTTADQRYFNLPGGYLQMRNIQLNTNPITPLEYITPEMLDRLYGGDTTGKPRAYTLIGDEIQLAPIPDSTYTLEMAFYEKFTALGDGTSGTVTSNWLTTNAPDVLLYGALLEAEPFIKNDERIALWLNAFNSAIRKVQDADAKDRHSGSAMRVRNIYSGVEG